MKEQEKEKEKREKEKERGLSSGIETETETVISKSLHNRETQTLLDAPSNNNSSSRDT